MRTLLPFSSLFILSMNIFQITNLTCPLLSIYSMFDFFTESDPTHGRVTFEEGKKQRPASSRSLRTTEPPFSVSMTRPFSNPAKIVKREYHFYMLFGAWRTSFGGEIVGRWKTFRSSRVHLRMARKEQIPKLISSLTHLPLATPQLDVARR